MRALVWLSIVANSAASLVLIWIVSHMSNYDADRNGLAIWLMASLLGLNLAVLIWTLLNVDNSRVGRLFSLWLKAKERDLERRASAVKD
jgi:hypothetical protein